LPTGDLKWKPKPFEFKVGESIRYIDFENGNDNNDGKSKATPWKHHPWDKNTTANSAKSKGIDTYIFKKGVVYRGVIRGEDESGTEKNPIRLTSDPSWGEGDAMLWGSTAIKGGWKQCTKADVPEGMPSPEKVWYYDGLKLDKTKIKLSLYNFWEVSDEKIVRVELSREPNWKHVVAYDPFSQWYTITKRIHGKKDKKAPKELHWLKIDDKNLVNRKPGSLHGARYIASYGDNMGTPCFGKTPVTHNELYAKNNGFKVGHKGAEGSRFFFENLPGFLDEGGEFYIGQQEPLEWKQGENKHTRPADKFPGRIYIRLKDDKNPNDISIEVSTRDTIILLQNQQNINISGLSFSFTAWHRGFPAPNNNGNGVRIFGNSKNIEVNNCKFTYMHAGVGGFTGLSKKWAKIYHKEYPQPKQEGCYDVLENITVRDNYMEHLDSNAISFVGLGVYNQKEHMGLLGHLRVLRNKIQHVGFRHYQAEWSAIPTINASGLSTGEFAGNIIDNVWGSGLFLYGGAGRNWQGIDIPLIRVLVYNNKVTNSLLASNDWGGIETWEGGPIYIFNNQSGNAVGPRTDLQYKLRKDPNLSGWQRSYICNAYAFYQDGAYKHYSFNNIAWGREWEDPAFQNRAGGMTVGNFMCPWWNNTFYNMYQGQSGYILGISTFGGTIYSEIETTAIAHKDPQNISVQGGGYSANSDKNVSLFTTLGYKNNVFHKVKTFATMPGFKNTSEMSVEDITKGLKEKKFIAAELGVVENNDVMQNPSKGDFRPTANSKGKNKGIKHFVPWSLYKTVGEWNFTRYPKDLRVIIGQHWNMTHEHLTRSMYYKIPRHDLMVPNAKETDFVKGVLEDWTDGGALHFDGKSTYAILKHSDITADWNIGMKVVGYAWGKNLKKDEKAMYPGEKRETPNIKTSNFIIEAYFRTEKGHTNGTLVSKLTDKGYALEIDNNGCAVGRLVASAYNQTVVSKTKINDEKWHHIMFEIDKDAKQISLAIDGKWDIREKAPKLTKEMSFENKGDFMVGVNNNNQKFFAGDLDFLRISQGSFADSKTTLEELYAWQFNGPNLRDFTGVKPADGKRDAGAIDYKE